MRRQKERLESALNEYRKLRRGFITARIQKAHQSRSTEIRDITFENDEIESRAVHAITSLSENLPILNGVYCDFLQRYSERHTRFIDRRQKLQLTPSCMSFRLRGIALHAKRHDNARLVHFGNHT